MSKNPKDPTALEAFGYKPKGRPNFPQKQFQPFTAEDRIKCQSTGTNLDKISFAENLEAITVV